MKIIFAGTPEFAVAPLLALLADHEVVAVFTQPDRRSGRGKKLTAPPVKKIALEHNIPVFQPSSLRDQASVISALEPDVMVVVAYGMLLPQAILELPKIACINIHASILPKWRGAAPIQRAIEAGDAESGVSIMQMELGLDTGPVYEMLTVDIDPEDTSETLHDKLSDLGALGIVSTLAKLEVEPDLPATQQDDSQSSYAKKILKAEAEIDWTQSASNIGARIRAFVPWPVCQSHHHGNKIRIWHASPSSTDSNSASDEYPAGSIIEINDDGIIITCGQGSLKLEVLQRDGSKAMPFDQFSNGYRFMVGEQFSAPATHHSGSQHDNVKKA